MIFTHLGFGALGLVAWVSYVVTGLDWLAWTGVGLLMPGIGLGICTVTLWAPYPTPPAHGMPVTDDAGPGGAGPVGGMLAAPPENAIGDRLTDEGLAKALASEAHASRLINEALAGLPAQAGTRAEVPAASRPADPGRPWHRRRGHLRARGDHRHQRTLGCPGPGRLSSRPWSGPRWRWSGLACSGRRPPARWPRAGVPALLFEQFGLGHDRGSSHGATRIFRYSYPDPCYVEMAVRASEAWAALAADAGEELLVRTGGLDAGPGAEDCADALAECGVEHAWLTGAQVRDRFPGIGARPGERMLFQPDSGVCLAGRTVAALQRLARRDGAAIRAGTPVLGIEAGRDQVLLRTAAGEVTARAAVITAGPWAQGVLAGALPQAPRLTATVQQVRYFAPRDPAAPWPTLIEWPPRGPVLVRGARGRRCPRGEGGRAHPRPARWTRRTARSRRSTRRWKREAAGYVRDRLPGLDPAGLAAETCLYTMTADEDFVLDRAGPLVVGGGCSGHAFKFGPLLGEFLAGLALGQDIPVPRERFALRRPSLAAS